VRAPRTRTVRSTAELGAAETAAPRKRARAGPKPAATVAPEGDEARAAGDPAGDAGDRTASAESESGADELLPGGPTAD
jgi:hypothetical protein